MRAARIHGNGGPDVLQIDEVDRPTPGPREILVRQRATTINHRDIWIRKGHPSPAYRVKMPAILGIDVSGEVVEVGDEVDYPRLGARVTINPYMPCGQCEECRRARPQFCHFFDVYHGAYAEYAVVPADLAIEVSSGPSDIDVACFPNAYPTAWEMLIGKAGLGPDDTVFVWAGTSGLGIAAIDIAHLVGARVITSAGSESKRELLRSRGLEVVDHYDGSMVEKVIKATDGRGVSIVFEHVGSATWARSFQLCRPGGTIVTAGATSGDDIRMNVTDLFVKQLRILGSRVASMDSALASALQLERGKYNPLVGVTMPLDEIAEAHHLLETGKIAGKIIITFN